MPPDWGPWAPFAARSLSAAAAAGGSDGPAPRFPSLVPAEHQGAIGTALDRDTKAGLEPAGEGLLHEVVDFAVRSEAGDKPGPQRGLVRQHFLGEPANLIGWRRTHGARALDIASWRRIKPISTG